MGRFSTAFIVAKDDPTIRVEFQIFPDDLVISKSAEYNSYPVVGRSEPYRVYSHSNPQTYTFTLPFVESISVEDDPFPIVVPIFVGHTVAVLNSFTYPQYLGGLAKAPPLVYFVVGSYIMEQCIVRSVVVTHPRETFWGIDVPIIPGLPVELGAALSPYYGLVSLQLEVVNNEAPGFEEVGYYGFGFLNNALGSMGSNL